MFAHHHLSSPLRRPCLRSFPRLPTTASSAGQHRSISASLSRRAEVPGTVGQEQPTESLPQIEDMSSQNEGEGGEKGPATYKEFMAKIGDQYKYTQSKPRNWLSPNAVELFSFVFPWRALIMYRHLAFPHEPFFQTSTTYL